MSGIHLFLANCFFSTPTGPDVLNWLREKRLQHRTVTGWYCCYHRNVQSVIQVVHWVIWESIDTHQWYLYLHDVTTTSQQSSDCIVHPSQQKRCSEMGINLEKWCIYIYLLYTCLVFRMDKICWFPAVFLSKKKKTWRPKSARSILRILRWSGGWSFMGDPWVNPPFFDGASINGVAGGAF